jgi:hypothetical protein
VRLGVNSIPFLCLGLIVCHNTYAADRGPSTLPADSLSIKCDSANVWDQYNVDGQVGVAELRGPVSIEVDHTKMSADNAVVWLNPNPGGTVDSHRVQIALIGHARLEQQGVLRLDQRLLVDAVVTGNIQMVGKRTAAADESSILYRAGEALRQGKPATTSPATMAVVQPATVPVTLPEGLAPIPPLADTTRPATPPRAQPQTAPSAQNGIPAAQNPGASPGPGSAPPIATVPASKWPHEAPVLKPVSPPAPPPALPSRFVQFDGDFDRTITPDGDIAAVCRNGVNLRYRDAKGNLLEFVAHDMVLFTNLKQAKGAGAGEDARQFIEDHVEAAYFEGDVQVYATPNGGKTNELRMRAERVYYELDTDRAIMTDVLFHTVDIQKQIPIFIRAAKMRQLSQGEFDIQGLGLTNSAFATPTYSLQASHAYVREEDTGDPALGDRITYSVNDAVVQAFGLPIFYFPSISGSTTSKGNMFRTADLVTDSTFGDGVRTRWGLFETFGIIPPKGMDLSYTLDYLSKRGPAGGIDGLYGGGFIDENTKQPWNWVGDFKSYFVDDHGQDILGADRIDSYPAEKLRGRAYFEHQEFMPDGWEAEVRLGYISDSNFLVQWFNDEYINNLPLDDSIYLKHSSGSEQYSFLAEAQPNRAISNADEEEENREVSRLPEVNYDRVGDSLMEDHLSFFSENTASELKFVQNTQTIQQQGFWSIAPPGEPAFAYTGDPGDTVFRGDSRQELDFPLNAGTFKIVPYTFGRYTAYSASVVPTPFEPQTRAVIPRNVIVGGDVNRVTGGGGFRLTTDFWKVDDSIDSDLFDLHRIRHVVSPELNVFGSASNYDQDRLFIYDPEIDAVNDVEAVQAVLRQRWQTKRGGPGRWRSVDFFTLDLYGNFFGNQPSNRFRDPVDFRGLFFYSNPEASIPRNSANMDSTWRLSDSMTVLADVQQNLDRQKLATAAIGVAVQREARLSYYIADRYIADLDSNVLTFELNYKLDEKYSLQATEALDLAQNKDVFYTFTLNRLFDNFILSAQLYYDQTTANHGFSINIHPLGTGGSVGSYQLAQPTP